MSNFYCAAPWRGLHINIRGDVKTCCAGNPNMLGNLNDKGIEEILNGSELQEIRSVLAQGKQHPYCVNCTDRESKGADSERTWQNKVNEDFNHVNAGLDYEYPTLIDVRWNSTCNLSCNYCSPMDSSKWAALKHIPVSSNTRHYYTDVCDFIEQNHHHVREVALVGGEPLLLPENERLLDVIPNDCVVTVITNLNNPLENNRVFRKLADRSNVGWSISFDNIEERFEYVRYGADWNLMLKNLDIVQNLMQTKKQWGGIHAVYNLYNATRLVEFKQFATSRGLSIKWQNLSGPLELDPRNHGSEIAQLSAIEIERAFAICTIDSEERDLFESALNTYRSRVETNPTMIKKLQEFVDQIETKYHIDRIGDFARLWPELGNVINGR